MDYTEFEAKALDAIRSEMTWMPADQVRSRYADAPVRVSWTSGGITGGSCWGGTPDQPVEAEDEPELELLDAILTAVRPDVTFLQYKKIVASCITRGSSDNHDYYGNYSTEAYKEFTLRGLYRTLGELGLVV